MPFLATLEKTRIALGIGFLPASSHVYSFVRDDCSRPPDVGLSPTAVRHWRPTRLERHSYPDTLSAASLLRGRRTLDGRVEVASMNCLALVSTTDLTEMNETTRIEAHIQSRLSGRIYGFRVLRQTSGLILRGRTRT